jgi:ribosomal protein S18 acetylase RimI-like enzyme
VEVRLMDITLLPDHRNLGLGTRLVSELLRYADALQRQMSLHVEPFNPAKRMYERMGFKVSETRGLYEFMVREAPRAAPPPAAAS